MEDDDTDAQPSADKAADDKADESESANKDAARRERFKKLKMRLNQSTAQNKQELFADFRRQKVDPVAQARMERRKADAELELAKIEAREDGEDFERKRAWDWTIEESEKWDERVASKKKAKETALFADYAQAAERTYERELREFKPDMEAYLNQKTSAVAKSGQLIEGTDGSVVGIDSSKRFYADANSLNFADSKPPKDAVDRLVNSVKKAEEQRVRKKKTPKEDDDILAINDKNKKFNAKLSRYYDKYTKEIRDSFERGTAL
ncbi:SYF2 splicing factor-domain-containing protein [Limtongia smithiae]|uniref:SYF2 splicing factor-domain-containing protein n=1 Tax=Limtongia smithiae TaxID=1125753 RepID=UPI0034CD3711